MSNPVRDYVLEYQRKNNLPDWQMCNILCMDETEWHKFAHGYGCALTTFQQIMFIAQTNTPLPD